LAIRLEQLRAFPADLAIRLEAVKAISKKGYPTERLSEN